MSITRAEDIAHVRFAAPDLGAMRKFLEDFGLACFEQQGVLYGLKVGPDPVSPTTRVRIYAAAAAALMRWEPRLRLTRVSMLSGLRPGQVVLDLEGLHITPTGTQPVGLQVDLERIGK